MSENAELKLQAYLKKKLANETLLWILFENEPFEGWKRLSQ